MPSDMAYRKAFGSWGNALIECGFEVQKPFPSEKCRQAVSSAKKGKFAELSSNWKGGRFIDKSGYERVWNPHIQKYEFEHRKVIEAHLGRSLNKFEEVHHKNGIKNDNRLENLEVLTKPKHSQLHEKIQGKMKHERKKTIKCAYPDCEQLTSSKYNLCTKHYKSQWGKLKNGTINSLQDFNFKERNHSDETKQKLSEIAKNQPRKSGKFAK